MVRVYYWRVASTNRISTCHVNTLKSSVALPRKAHRGENLVTKAAE